MSPSAILLADLTNRGIRLVANGEKLRVEARAGALTPEIKAALVAQKTELLAHLTATEDHAAFLAEVGATFPGSTVVTDIPMAELDDAFLRFCRLTVETFPDVSTSDRLGRALRCLHGLLPGGEREASERIRSVALYVWERLWSLTIGEIEGLL